MDILNSNTVFKVTGFGEQDNLYFTHFIPSSIRRNKICKLIEESNLFIHHGKSRIDGFELYSLDKVTIRSIKMNKIFNETNISTKLDNLMKEIKDDIDYVSVLM